MPVITILILTIVNYVGHILRNMNALAESWGTNKIYGMKLVRLIRLLFRLQHRFEKHTLSEKAYRERMKKLRIAWRQLELASRRCVTPRYQNRCSGEHDDMCWVFLSHDGVPLTNNEAERSVSYVLWRKGSYGVWSHRANCSDNFSPS